MAPRQKEKRRRDERKPARPGKVSRRTVLGSAVSATSVALIPLGAVSCAGPISRSEPRALSDTARRTLVAFTGRIIPADSNGPGAVEAGAAGYIERSLSEWNSRESARINAALEALNAYSLGGDGTPFAELSEARQDAILEAMEGGRLEGFDDAMQLFNRLRRLTLEGTFSDPYYGGNRNYIGWDLIGYPGALMASTPELQRMGGRLPPLHTSAYGGEYDGNEE